MPTTTHTVRIPDDLKAAADQAADDLRISFSDFVRAALSEKLGKEDRSDAQMRAAVQAAVRGAEAEAHRLRLELGRAQRRLALATGRHSGLDARPAARAAAEAALAAELGKATPQAPATLHGLQVATGQEKTWLARRLNVLVASGCLAKPRTGEYVHVPGADIEAGLAEARGRFGELAPRRKNAAAGDRDERIAQARNAAEAAGAPLVAASDLSRPGAAVFQPPGEDKTVTEVPAGKPRGARRTQCPHRLPAGAWCKTCQQPK